MEAISQVTDVTKEIKDLGISEKLIAFMKKRQIPGASPVGTKDDYHFCAQIGKFPPNSGMQIYLQKPHVTIFCLRKDDETEARVISINPRDRSLGPDVTITLTESQYDSLKTILDQHFDELSVRDLLKFESLN
jgi:hypothetical protein